MPPMIPLRCSIVLLACLLPVFLRAEEQPRVSLFNGSDLTGWHSHNNCEAEVADGCLRLKAGDGLLWLVLQLRKFVFEADWRPLKERQYDAGIYFRCDLPAEGKPFPAKYQVNLKQADEANLIGFKDGRSMGLFK